jgi:hypothetical protein
MTRAIISGLLVGLVLIMPVGYDWHHYLYPAAQTAQIWTVPGIYNPWWSWLILAPFGLLPEAISWRLWLALNLAGYLAALRGLGLDWEYTGLVMLSWPVLHGLRVGNMDGLVMAGAVLTPGLGIWLLALKPQSGLVGLALAVRSLYQARDFASLAGLVGACLIGLLGGAHQALDLALRWNVSAWPWSIPVGAVLAWLAWRRDNLRLALAAAPMLSPYVAWQSWAGALLVLPKRLLAGLVGVGFAVMIIVEVL